MKNRIFEFVCFILCVIAIFTYRFFLIKNYSSINIDDDSACMWYGLIAFKHFAISEPHFIGQKIHSMLEALLALPLYMFKMPINFALPLSTFIFWFSPFLLCSILLYKFNKLGSIIILIGSLLYSFEYDLITSIPRGHIPGYIFAFMGVLLLICHKKEFYEKYIACKIPIIWLVPVLICVGYIVSPQSVLVSFSGIIYCFLYDKKVFKNKKELIFGLIIGIALIYYCNYLFYIQNPEYNLHDGYSMKLSFDVFIENFKNIFKILSFYSFVSYKSVPIFLIIAFISFIIFVIKKKQYKLLFLVALEIFLFVFTMFFENTNDYYPSLLFSQNRFFLFVPYLVLFILFIFFSKNKFLLKSHYYYCVATVCIFTAIFKINFLDNYISKNQDYINQDYAISIENSEFIFNSAKYIRELTEKNNVKIVVFMGLDTRALCYATSALNYEYYTSYLATYERRTPIYLFFKNIILNNENVLFIYSKYNNSLYYNIENINSTTLTDYIFKKYGFSRRS